MNIIYENKYGRLELEIIDQYKRVSDLKSKEFDPTCFFTIDESEKIALITENNGIQLGFAFWDHTKAFVIHHESSSIAVLCRIVSLEFDHKIDARSVLDSPRAYRGPFFPSY